MSPFLTVLVLFSTFNYVAPFSQPSFVIPVCIEARPKHFQIAGRTPRTRRTAITHSAITPDVANSEIDTRNTTSAFAKSYLEPLQHLEKVPHDNITPSDTITMGVASAAMILAFVGLLSASGPGGWRYYLAGGVCAAISHSVATPIDVVKTRKQVDPDLVNTSFAKATARIIEKDGIKTLLSGLGPTTFGYLLEGSLKFGIYEIMKPAAKRGLTSLAQLTSLAFLQSQMLSFAVCGAISGVAASMVLCPMEAIRIRIVSEPNFCTGNWVEGGYKMVKSEGVSALSKGLTPMLYKQVPYTISKNVAFDILTRMSYGAMQTWGMAVTGVTKVLIPLVCAFITSVLSTISSQPGDMLLSLVNAHEGTKRTNDFMRDILKGDWGIKGFFVGVKSRFLHVGIIVTTQLILYDFIKRLVGVAATGSV